MALRSARERVFQTLCYEAGGLLLATPLYALYAGHGAGEGTAVMLALSLGMMLWSPLHNTVFDWTEFRLSGRLASDRPHRWRLCHAASHEATAVVVTTPLLVWLGGHGWVEALMVDFALTLFYGAYAYLFHLGFDRWRPVRRDRPLAAPAPALSFSEADS